MPRTQILELLLLAAAFGVVEAGIVVALRQFLDPAGSQFPLVAFPPALLRVEQAREAASLVLLVGAARLAASGRVARWATFLVAFGAWDLVYYLVLRLVLGWPGRVTDWDLLFLLPVPWYGPVYAPLLVAATMFCCGLVMLYEIRCRGRFLIRSLHVAAVAAGALVITASFVAAGAGEVEGDRYWLGALAAGEAIGLIAFGHAWWQTRRTTVG